MQDVADPVRTGTQPRLRGNQAALSEQNTEIASDLELSKWLLCKNVRLGRFRIEQFGKAWIVRHILKIGVAARLDAVLRIEFDCGDQMF